MPLGSSLPPPAAPTQPTGGPKPPSSSTALPTNDMLEPDFAEAFSAWQNRPSPQANGLMLKKLDPIINTAVKTYGGANPSPTLRSKARLLALQGLPKYDRSQAKLKTFMMNHLQGLRRMSAKENAIISVPEQVQLDSLHLSRAEAELRDDLGRDPSTSELADHTGLSSKRIQYVRRLQMPLSEGQVLQPIAGSDSDDFNDPAVKSTGSDDTRAWHQFVYESLEPVDRVIMEHTLGMYGRPVLSNQDIARKLGITPSAVSQRKTRIQLRMDERQNLGVL
jgi:DNA-directed RNA polymerase specialized sigma subunit